MLTDDRRRLGRWEPGEVFASGEAEVAGLLAYLDELGLPARRRAALDHGCGVGRLTGPLAARFESCLGVDVSPAMLAEARRLNSDVPNARFADATELRELPAASFDLVYSSLVLQHAASRSSALGQVGALARLLAPGGALVIQAPEWIPRVRRLQPRRRLYGALRSMRVPPRFLYRRLRLDPMHMRALPRRAVVDAISVTGATVVAADTETLAAGVRSVTYVATRRA